MDASVISTWNRPILAIGTAFAAFSTGAVLSLSVVTMPVVLANTTKVSILRAWKEAYDIAHKVNPPFGAVATLAYATLTFMNRSSSSSCLQLMLAATIITFAFVPFTLMFIVPMNEKLLKRADVVQNMPEDKVSREMAVDQDFEIVQMIQKWTRYNFIRSLFPAVGSVLAYLALS